MTPVKLVRNKAHLREIAPGLSRQAVFVALPGGLQGFERGLIAATLHREKFLCRLALADSGQRKTRIEAARRESS
jgi:hypothetical protein